jgi:hypothetical protein
MKVSFAALWEKMLSFVEFSAHSTDFVEFRWIILRNWIGWVSLQHELYFLTKSVEFSWIFIRTSRWLVTIWIILLDEIRWKWQKTQRNPLKIAKNSTKSQRNLNIFSRSAAEVYPLWYRSIDLSTDPGLKSHLITFPCSEWTAVCTVTFIYLEYNEYTNHINHTKMSPCLIASKWSIINRSLHRSRFKAASDHFSMCTIDACIYCNHFLIFTFF